MRHAGRDETETTEPVGGARDWARRSATLPLSRHLIAKRVAPFDSYPP